MVKPNRHFHKLKHLSYKPYTSRVLKQGHPDMTLTKESSAIVDSMCNDMFERIMHQAVHLVKVSGKKTLTERDIQFAIKLIFPGKLAPYAISFADKCMLKYKQGNGNKQEGKTKPVGNIRPVSNNSLIDTLTTIQEENSIRSSELDYGNFSCHVPHHSSLVNAYSSGSNSHSSTTDDDDDSSPFEPKNPHQEYRMRDWNRSGRAEDEPNSQSMRRSNSRPSNNSSSDEESLANLPSVNFNGCCPIHPFQRQTGHCGIS